jgi:hypothetical protein
MELVECTLEDEDVVLRVRGREVLMVSAIGEVFRHIRVSAEVDNIDVQVEVLPLRILHDIDWVISVSVVDEVECAAVFEW